MKAKTWQRMVVVAALLSSTALGQSKGVEQIVQVPFAFVVADQSLPAGRYFVTNITETRLRICSVDRKSAIVQTYGTQGRAPESVGKMVFHRYRSVYFLSEVWTPGQSIGQKLMKSRVEEELRADGTGRQIAVLQITAGATQARVTRARSLRGR